MFTVLVVSRDPASATAQVDAMEGALAARPDAGIVVRLAVTDVDEGTPGPLLSVDLIAGAGLVVASDRATRARVARLSPAVRPRLFTMTQAAELAARIAALVVQGRLPLGAPPLPGGPTERMAWLVVELDAARGQLAGWPKERLDLPMEGTRRGAEQIRNEASRLASAFITLASQTE